MTEVDTAAQLFEGVHPIGVSVSVAVEGSDLVIMGDAIQKHYLTSAAKVSPRVAQSPRFVALPDGQQLLCADSVWLDRLPAQVSSEGPVAWLEQRWGVALGCVLLVAVLLITGYIYGLPVAAKAIARAIPFKSEQAFGVRVLEALDAQHLFKSTTLDDQQVEQIRTGFARLVADRPIAQFAHVELRASKFLGANAFALPGGTIVVTDDLVKLATPTELDAVLAHELGHVEGRHALRQLIQSSTIAVVITTVLGDATSASVAVSSVPILLKANYSRELESEADAFAFTLLSERGISPNEFASIMEKLDQATPARGFSRFFDSHPQSNERIQRAHDAAAIQKTE